MPDPKPIDDETRVALAEMLGVVDYAFTEELAGSPALAFTGLESLIAEIEAQVAEALILPPSGEVVRRSVLALLAGHLILEGPPGTGKTTLARILAEAFNCTFDLVTGAVDWTTYDVIGGLEPAVIDGVEVIRPRLGAVSHAALRCAETVRSNTEAGSGPQAHWLIIDEFSRADVDKAFGGLFTALGGGDPSVRRLRLSFEDAPQRQSIWLPARFRIIGTINSVDTAFVHALSQGLQRRFHFVYLGVPEPSQIEAELQFAADAAVRRIETEYGAGPEPLPDYAVGPAFGEARALLTTLVASLRYPEGEVADGWRLGTAQVADVLQQLALTAREPDVGTLMPALDAAIADRIIPQLAGVSSDQLDYIQEHLATAPFATLERSRRGLERIRTPGATHLS